MCGASVEVPEKAKVGSIVFCEQCDAELEVITLQPLELDWPLDDFEDDDYDDDFDDDDYDYDD